MPGPETRSVHGATYVLPVKPNARTPNEECEIRLNRPFEKAAILVTLWRDPTVADRIATEYRSKYLSEASELNEEQRKNHSALLSSIESYSNNRSYGGLVSSVKHANTETMMAFSQNWLNLEHELLAKSLEDWQVTAEEELRADVHQAPPEKAEEAVEKMTTESPAPAFLTMPRVWNKMWQDERRQNSARFLAAYLFTTEAIPEVLLDSMVPPSETRVLPMTQAQQRSGTFATPIFPLRLVPPLYPEIIKQMLMDQNVGLLLLERFDYTPVAYEMGELVYTLPLSPGEKTTVSHREWSNTTEEYVKEVEEVVEEEREKAVSEDTEITESTKSEKEVEHKAGASVAAKGGMGAWSIEARASYDFRSALSTARDVSSKRAQEITNKASSRSKTEHKMSFKVAREVHVEDEQVRQIENKSNKPVRWDFYRMMRKWKIDLYHIGMRMTYDIVVPEPAEFLLRKYVDLKEMQDEIDKGDPFNVTPEGITKETLLQLSAEWGVELPQPPGPDRQVLPDKAERSEEKTVRGTRVLNIEFREGYNIDSVTVVDPPDAVDTSEGVFSKTVKVVETRPSREGGTFTQVVSKVLFENDIKVVGCRHMNNILVLELTAPRNVFPWVWDFLWGKNVKEAPSITLDVTALPTDEHLSSWRMKCFATLREAARAKWLAHLQDLQSQRDRLTAELMGMDSLKLRQVEREEIMKAVLRWLLGPEFEFYPEELNEDLLHRLLFRKWTSGGRPEDPVDYYYPSTGRLRRGPREMFQEYGKVVRFIHQAIEWENVNWILYSYFWTPAGRDAVRWRFKQSLDHPDPYHRSFLRAGCARVVIPIREGFVKDWFEYMEDRSLDDDDPVLMLGEDMRHQAQANYAYTPDPNRDELVQFGSLQDTWYEYTPTGSLHIEEGEAPGRQGLELLRDLLSFRRKKKPVKRKKTE